MRVTDQRIIKRLKTLIDKSGKTQRQIAGEIGLTENQFSSILYGRKVLEVEMLIPLALALGASVYEILCDTMKSAQQKAGRSSDCCSVVEVTGEGIKCQIQRKTHPE